MKLNALFLFFAIILVGCKQEFSEDNFNDEKWINDIAGGKDSTKENFADTTLLSVPISSKKVMLGFLKPTNLDSNGMFGKFIQIFDRFYSTPHNPFYKKEYLFFNGDGSVWKKTSSETDLFDPKNYQSNANNLNNQFDQVSKEITEQSFDKRKFSIILSDGETTIRRYRNDNADKLSDIETDVKTILMRRPDICIGVISVLGTFDGDYTYEPDMPARSIRCNRYLYAFCFFDKSFLPEFERFAEEAINLKGKAFIFNPKIENSFVQSECTVYPLQNGAKNKSTSENLVAYSFKRNLPDSLSIKYLVKNLQFTGLPHLNYSIYHYKPIKRYNLTSDTAQTQTSTCPADQQMFEVHLSLGPNLRGGIYRIEIVPDYKLSIEHLLDSSILSQDIDNNTIDNVEKIGPSDTLKTEGLKDLYRVIFKALKDIQQPPFHQTFVSIFKN